MDCKSIEEEIVEYKVYKEKPYLNSDRDPLGITINGKSKEYIHAHDAIKKLIKKGKQYCINDTQMRILDVTNNKAMTNAIVEVSEEGGTKGNVELKIYIPSVHRKKGATIEMRKMSGFEYSHVKILKKIVTILLDGFISGEDPEQVLDNLKKGETKKTVSRVTSKPKLFTCEMCNWQTRFASALKSHRTRIHSNQEQFQCDVCIFKANTRLSLDDHIKKEHTRNKRMKSKLFAYLSYITKNNNIKIGFIL